MKITKIAIATLLTLLLSSTIILGRGLAPTASSTEDGSLGWHYEKTVTKTFNKRTCYGGYRALKRILKIEAKLKCNGYIAERRWYRKGCVKIKRKHHRTKVRVTGHFQAYCRNR